MTNLRQHTGERAMQLCATGTSNIRQMRQSDAPTGHHGDSLTGLPNQLGECRKMIGHVPRPAACQHAAKAELDEIIQRKAMIRHGVERPVTYGCHWPAGFPQLLHSRIIQSAAWQCGPENEGRRWIIPKLPHHFTKLFCIRIRQAKVAWAKADHHGKW